MYVIKNITPAKIELAPGVYIDPGEQLSIAHLTDSMQDAADAGALQIKLGDPTLEERKADVAAIESFKP